MKICKDCGVSKGSEHFYARREARDGLHYYCKACVGARRKRYLARLKQEPVSEKFCPGCGQNKQAGDFPKQSKDGLRPHCLPCTSERHAACVVGVSVTERAEILSTGCLICGSFENLHVDHDHSCCPGRKSCGKCIRGAACNRCNVGMGQFQDDPDRLEAAAAHLRSGRRWKRTSVSSH